MAPADFTERVSLPRKGNASPSPEKYCCPPLYYPLPSPFQSLTLCTFQTGCCFYMPLPWKHMPVRVPPFSNDDKNNQKWPADRKTGFRYTKQSERESEINPGSEKQTGCCYTPAACFMTFCSEVLVLVLANGWFMDENTKTLGLWATLPQKVLW